VSPQCTEDCGLARFPKGHPETTEADKQRMMAALYAAGWGYHAIADLSGRTHADLRELLVSNFPARPEAPRWKP
jgi:hypothetical protein